MAVALSSASAASASRPRLTWLVERRGDPRPAHAHDVELPITDVVAALLHDKVAFRHEPEPWPVGPVEPLPWQPQEAG